MTPRPVERESVSAFRAELFGFSEFLHSLGDTFFSAKFLKYAHELQAARTLADVRKVQRQSGRHLKGTIGTLNDGPPGDRTSIHYTFRGTPHDLHRGYEQHLNAYRYFAR